MAKITRGISEKFAAAFVKSNLYKLYSDNMYSDKNKEALFLGVRNGYINLYYNGASVCKVRGTLLKCEVAQKYLYGA